MYNYTVYYLKLFIMLFIASFLGHSIDLIIFDLLTTQPLDLLSLISPVFLIMHAGLAAFFLVILMVNNLYG